MSSRKYFKYCLYSTGIWRCVCGKIFNTPVDKNVENSATLFALNFAIFDMQASEICACGNRIDLYLKKYFLVKKNIYNVEKDPVDCRITQ